MITEETFGRIMEAAGTYRYSSLQYADFEDCRGADVDQDGDGVILLCDHGQSPAFLYFAANDFHKVIEKIEKIREPLRINFVPHAYAQKLFDIGFEVWGEYIDYVHKDLKASAIGPHSHEGMEFLRGDEYGAASLVSQTVKGQSRGFGGETAAWFAEWIAENDVLVVREKGEIAGYCCVSIYRGGTTLWIREIAVSPAFQGKGYGQKLIEQAISYGIQKGAAKGFLAVDTMNRSAIHIYEKYGFLSRGGEGELQMIRR